MPKQKLLKHFKDTVESVVIAGTLSDEGGELIVTGESGEEVRLFDYISGFVGEDITVSFKKNEKEQVEVID